MWPAPSKKKMPTLSGSAFCPALDLTQVPKLREALQRRGLDDVQLIVGGIIPEDDVPELKAIGVAKVFTPGTPLAEITGFVAGGQDRQMGE